MVFICAESELSHCWYSGYTQCSVSSRGSFQEYFLSAWAAGAGCWVMDWKWPHVSLAMLHSRSILENLFQIVPCLDNWQFRLNCMTADFRAELLLNVMSVFAHDEVVPKQNVRKIWMLLQSRVSTEIPWSNTTWRESEMYFFERHFIGL